ncbi:hypothetical protein GCM10027413_09180 [Conyzicola nivalis]|uniref:Protein-glutamine gamma-glutamyltransferase-like C-terminal domain-containing protein n=1 Tax=Conyzicola nivalis TaxID=1477021 RepID=A0A916SJG0_9MICO|nr:DUF4129 domain-containing protein [Conyzicola nivalis]GGB03294.1 hypothetical protein GCM10010979_17450 [Conyzicola nivalis]
MIAAGFAGRTVPVDPDADQARQWLIDELAKPDYRAAQPTWFDLVSAAIGDWFASLRFGGVDGGPNLGALLVILAVVVALVVAFLVFGLPRFARKSGVTGDLFGDSDDRDSTAIRAAAEAAAAAGDFDLAVLEIFRSTARSLAERTVVTTSPGTTAHDFAQRAAVAFPDFADPLATAAVSFDGVRYLGRAGTRAEYEAMARLESGLRAARPLLQAVTA